MKTTEEQNLALMKAKLQFMSKEGATFFTTILVSLKHEYSDEIETAATNGLSILYNPQFFMALKPQERVGLIMHEVLHCAMSHMCRAGDRKHGKFNRACDYSINIIAVDAGFQIPEGGLLDNNYRDMTPEAIYDELGDDPQDEEPNDIIYTNNGDIQNQIDDILIAAEQAAAAKGEAGNIPGELQRHIDGLVNPVVPWSAIFRGFMTKLAKNKFDWKRRNRRFMADEVIMPSKAGVKLSNGAISIDVSGSIDEKQFSGFVSEGHTIVSKFSPDALTVLQFDHKLQSIDVVKKLQDFNAIKFTGGGGTDIRETLEWCRDNKPAFLVILTDGCFDMVDLKLTTPVIWLIYDYPEFTAPYGKVIQYTEKK